MSAQVSGVVVSVESARQGVIATSWSGALLSVWNAADVDRDGCDLTPDDGVTLWHATGEVAEGVTDDDPDVVTMAGPAPADWPAGGTDDDGQSIPTDTRLDLWPEVLDVIAQVDTGDDDLLPVSVPHALRPLLSEGLRDEGGGEQVICEARGTGWVIVDVIGRRGEIGVDGLDPAVQSDIATGVQASSKADTAQQAADAAKAAAASAAAQAGVAIASANGRNTSTHSTTDPTTAGVSGKTDGDMWYRHVVLSGKPSGDLSGPVDGQWTWQQGQWIGMGLTAGVFASVDGGVATFGSVSGLDIFSPGRSSLPRTQIVGSTISVIRAGAEGEEVPTVQLGGADDDQLMISDTDGSPLGGIDSDGNLLAQDVNINGALTVGGVALGDMLSPFTTALVARQRLGSSASTNNLKFNNSELGGPEIIFDVSAGRMYRVRFNGMLNSSAAGTAYVRFRAHSTSNHDVIPAAPTLADPQLASQVIVMPAAGSYPVNLETFIGPYDGTYRVGVSGQTSAAGVVGYFLSSDTVPSQFYVEDVGTYSELNDGGVNTMGGTPYSGSTSSGSTTTKTYTKSWNVAATRVWRGGSIGSGNLMQGSYGGLARYGMWLWDGSIAAAVGSGATVQSMFLTIKNIDFPMNLGGGGTVYLDTANNTSLPASPQTAAGSSFAVTGVKGGQTLKIAMPRDRWAGFASGATRGVWLGPGVGGSGSAYSHWSPSATITMTYVK